MLSYRNQSIDMKSKSVVYTRVYTLFQPRSKRILFSQNCILKNRQKKELNFSNSVFSSIWKTEKLFIIFLLIIPGRRLDQDEYVRLGLTSSEDIFKRSWSRTVYSSWPYVLTSKRLQDVLPRCLQDVLKTSSKRLQDVFKSVFKTSCKDIF